MNLADLLKKNIVMVPVVASVLVGTFTGVKYVVNLTDTINANQAEIQELKTMDVENIRRDMKVLTDNVNTIIAKNAQPVKYKNKTLTIKTTTPSWKQELLLIKTQIIEKINKKKLKTKIKDIKIL